MDQPLKLAILAPDIRAPGLISGIADFVSNQPHIEVCDFDLTMMSAVPRDLLAWEPSAVITPLSMADTPAAYQALFDLGVPVVATTSDVNDPRVSNVVIDADDIAAVAVEHLKSQGARYMTTVSLAEHPGFVNWIRSINAAGQRLEIPVLGGYVLPHELYLLKGEASKLQSAKLAKWAQALPPGTGIFCLDADTIRITCQALAQISRSIPDDIMVLCEDLTQRCLLCTPQVSSIDMPLERVGFEAAQLAVELCADPAAGPIRRQIPVEHVTTRGSTARQQAASPATEQIQKLIRRDLIRGITPELLAETMGAPLEQLESAFSAETEQTIAEAIGQARIDRVTDLATRTRFSMDRIAMMCGYPSQEACVGAFVAATGQIPSELRS